MRPIYTEEMKGLELEILRRFAEYCDKNGLRYYLYAGTLLGAVRHGGFIPWDDDVDVVMPRPDYERLLEITPKNPVSENIAVFSNRTNDDCICPFIKLVDLRTDGHEEHLNKRFNNGIWIDVFPLDGVPDDEAERNKFIAAQQKDIKLLSLCTRPLTFTPNPLKLIKRAVIYALYHNVDYREITARLEANSRRYDYDSCRLIGVTVFGGGHNNVIEKDGFEDGVKLLFEDTPFTAPGTYKEYLTHLFGRDYMTPPPESQRILKHHYNGWWKE